MDLSPFQYALITGALAAGASAGAVKASLNGAKAKIDEVHKKLHDHITEENNSDRETHERLAKVETKVDYLVTEFRGRK